MANLMKTTFALDSVIALETALRNAVKMEGLEAMGPVVLAVYENPWTTLPFRRRNELHVRIVLPQ